jgi:hypothetical protein
MTAVTQGDKGTALMPTPLKRIMTCADAVCAMVADIRANTQADMFRFCILIISVVKVGTQYADWALCLATHFTLSTCATV